MSWDFAADRPIYAQLIEQISLRIISGAYPPGSRLPSVRDLAHQATVNPNTMQRALAELENRGLVNTERTAGRYVTEDTSLIKEEQNMLAQQLISEFFRRMRQLGVSPKQALALAARAKEMKADE